MGTWSMLRARWHWAADVGFTGDWSYGPVYYLDESGWEYGPVEYRLDNQKWDTSEAKWHKSALAGIGGIMNGGFGIETMYRPSDGYMRTPQPHMYPQRTIYSPYSGFGADTSGFGISPVMAGISIASMALSTYHGYKRNDSVGWAIAWGLLGGLFPVITPAIALAQGFGERKR